jgi:hypothetical protein
MKKLSGFDLGVIIAFAVVTLLGGGAWWYLSGDLQQAQDDVKNANKDFVTYSTKSNIVVSASNGTTLQANIDLLKAQLDPLIHTKLRSKENRLGAIKTEDPVAWKHDLDDEVHRLNSAAKLRGVNVPPNFYFGFSRYLSQNPSDEQTAVLSKQLVGVDQVATILINASVKGIQAIRRSYEEDPHTSAVNAPGQTTELDHLGGYSLNGPGNTYTAYPFEIDFETTAENLRSVINNLVQSPYVFVVRTLTIQNSSLNSPMLNDLDKIAGTPASASSVIGTSPGEVAATTSTLGPQFLFGNSTLKIKARIDMIEWNTEVTSAATTSAHNAQPKTPPTPGANVNPAAAASAHNAPPQNPPTPGAN